MTVAEDECPRAGAGRVHNTSPGEGVDAAQRAGALVDDDFWVASANWPLPLPGCMVARRVLQIDGRAHRLGSQNQMTGVIVLRQAARVGVCVHSTRRSTGEIPCSTPGAAARRGAHRHIPHRQSVLDNRAATAAVATTPARRPVVGHSRRCSCCERRISKSRKYGSRERAERSADRRWCN